MRDSWLEEQEDRMVKSALEEGVLVPSHGRERWSALREETSHSGSRRGEIAPVVGTGRRSLE